ncbi:hypothetical protein HO173_009349 [Letharia columbiana]|uniref:Uncharacterized protein n=1 Tax=Letharia columbiana TaxID=112416 RepID=A0A8H6FPS1_9LECA|nr:uncharacterized protein HO173_009349 [Letharia columbiana]KAF6232469.1 hypothetical protein HO173_009349 [Letharia columbiana]
MNSYAARLASFTSWPHDSDNPFDFHATRSPECPFVRATQQKKKDRNQKTRRQQYTRRSLQATQPAHQSTQQATQPKHSVKQEEELQQTNAEKTAEKTVENIAEKPSGNKATIVKNTAHLSTIPRQIATQPAENDTIIWPIIPTILMWYITAMSTQEKDLLRRSQPIGPLQARVTYRTMHIWTN